MHLLFLRLRVWYCSSSAVDSVVAVVVFVVAVAVVVGVCS